MKDIRFSGVSGAVTVDITFRTDQISQDDENFNVTQITVGDEFAVNDKSDEDHAALFNDIKEVNHTLTDMKEKAAELGLTLTISDSDGENATILRQEESASESY